MQRNHPLNDPWRRGINRTNAQRLSVSVAPLVAQRSLLFRIRADLAQAGREVENYSELEGIGESPPLLYPLTPATNPNGLSAATSAGPEGRPPPSILSVLSPESTYSQESWKPDSSLALPPADQRRNALVVSPAVLLTPTLHPTDRKYHHRKSVSSPWPPSSARLKMNISTSTTPTTTTTSGRAEENPNHASLVGSIKLVDAPKPLIAVRLPVKKSEESAPSSVTDDVSFDDSLTSRDSPLSIDQLSIIGSDRQRTISSSSSGPAQGSKSRFKKMMSRLAKYSSSSPSSKNAKAKDSAPQEDLLAIHRFSSLGLPEFHLSPTILSFDIPDRPLSEENTDQKKKETERLPSLRLAPNPSNLRPFTHPTTMTKHPSSPLPVPLVSRTKPSSMLAYREVASSVPIALTTQGHRRTNSSPASPIINITANSHLPLTKPSGIPTQRQAPSTSAHVLSVPTTQGRRRTNSSPASPINITTNGPVSLAKPSGIPTIREAPSTSSRVPSAQTTQGRKRPASPKINVSLTRPSGIPTNREAPTTSARAPSAPTTQGRSQTHSTPAAPKIMPRYREAPTTSVRAPGAPTTQGRSQTNSTSPSPKINTPNVSLTKPSGMMPRYREAPSTSLSVPSAATTQGRSRANSSPASPTNITTNGPVSLTKPSDMPTYLGVPSTSTRLTSAPTMQGRSRTNSSPASPISITPNVSLTKLSGIPTNRAAPSTSARAPSASTMQVQERSRTNSSTKINATNVSLAKPSGMPTYRGVPGTSASVPSAPTTQERSRTNSSITNVSLTKPSGIPTNRAAAPSTSTSLPSAPTTQGRRRTNSSPASPTANRRWNTADCPPMPPLLAIPTLVVTHPTESPQATIQTDPIMPPEPGTAPKKSKKPRAPPPAQETRARPPRATRPPRADSLQQQQPPRLHLAVEENNNIEQSLYSPLRTKAERWEEIIATTPVSAARRRGMSVTTYSMKNTTTVVGVGAKSTATVTALPRIKEHTGRTRG